MFFADFVQTCALGVNVGLRQNYGKYVMSELMYIEASIFSRDPGSTLVGTEYFSDEDAFARFVGEVPNLRVVQTKKYMYIHNSWNMHHVCKKYKALK